MHFSDATSGWAGWALAHPEFGSSVNPIPTRGAEYAHPITASTPGFENITASLYDLNVDIFNPEGGQKSAFFDHLPNPWLLGVVIFNFFTI